MVKISSIDDFRKLVEERNRQAHAAFHGDSIAFAEDVVVARYGEVNRFGMTTVGLFTSGSCNLTIDNVCYSCSRASLVIIMSDQNCTLSDVSPDCQVSLFLLSDKVVEDSMLRFSDLMELIFNSLQNPHIKLRSSEYRKALRYYYLVKPLLAGSAGPYSEKAALSLMQALLFELCNVFNRRLSKKSGVQTRQQVISERFMYDAGKHFRENRSVQYYADRQRITPRHLSFVLKQQTGMTANKILDDFVIGEAKTLLRQSDMPVKMIAAELGFTDQSVFGKYFKKLVGISPANFRKNNKTS